MKTSESIKSIAISLVKFNGEINSISKDAKNPFFKSEYVTLDKLIQATREPLQKNGLIVIQSPLCKEDGSIGIQTILMHESGEFIESEPLYMKPSKQNDPQAAGSIISYLRRYSYQAILNLNTGEDDDANNASVKTKEDKSKSELNDAQIKRLYAIAKNVGYGPEEVKKHMIKKYNIESTTKLTKKQYDELCNGYESLKVGVN